MTEFEISGKSLDGYSLKRKEPSIERLPKAKRNELEEYVKEYIKFLYKCRTPDLVGEWFTAIAKDQGFVEPNEANNQDDFYMLNEDHTSFALVKPGTSPITEGIRIICTHTDSPALQIKPKPIIFNLDHTEQPIRLGVELDTFPYGGLQPYQWFARDVDILGWIVKNGRRRRIKFSGVIPDISSHVDNRFYEREDLDEAFQHEYLDIVTGFMGFKDLFKALNFKSEDDFARARLWAVPRNRPLKLENLLIGYGHDDRACTFAAVQALLSIKEPQYTTMVLGFDKEEVGSPGKDGAVGNFFEKVIYETAKTLGLDEQLLNSYLLSTIYDHSMALSGDVDIGAAKHEENWHRIDAKNTPKLGYGVFVSACDGTNDGNQISPAYVDQIMRLLEKNKIYKQMIGSPHPADEMGSSGSLAELFTNRGIKTLNMGVPIVGLHSPTEIMHVGDFYWMISAYTSFFNH